MGDLIQLADELIHLEDKHEREEMLKELFQKLDNVIFVAVLNGKVVGFIEICVFPDFVEGSLIAIIKNLVVYKKYRGIGVGSKLVHKVFQEAENNEVSEIHVWTEFENQQAINFYNSHGFGDRALLMERKL